MLAGGGTKTGEPGENPTVNGENQQQPQPTYGTGTGIKPRPHWWELVLSTLHHSCSLNDNLFCHIGFIFSLVLKSVMSCIALEIR